MELDVEVDATEGIGVRIGVDELIWGRGRCSCSETALRATAIGGAVGAGDGTVCGVWVGVELLEADGASLLHGKWLDCEDLGQRDGCLSLCLSMCHDEGVLSLVRYIIG